MKGKVLEAYNSDLVPCVGQWIQVLELLTHVETSLTKDFIAKSFKKRQKRKR